MRVSRRIVLLSDIRLDRIWLYERHFRDHDVDVDGNCSPGSGCHISTGWSAGAGRRRPFSTGDTPGVGRERHRPSASRWRRDRVTQVFDRAFARTGDALGTCPHADSAAGFRIIGDVGLRGATYGRVAHIKCAATLFQPFIVGIRSSVVVRSVALTIVERDRLAVAS